MLATALAGTAEAAFLHDSFSATYRSPAGAVPTGTNVRLRRATGERVRAVALRVEVADPVTERQRCARSGCAAPAPSGP